MDFSKKIRNLDVFKKVPKDFSQPTNLGGFISILTTLLIVYFIYAELNLYLYPNYTAEILQDKLVTREEMTINLDIEFPSYPCEIISLDLDDVMISHHPNIGSVQKWRLDKEGNYIDTRPYELLREPNPGKQLEITRHAFKNNYGCRLIGSFTVKEVPGNFHISCHAYFNHFLQMQAEGLVQRLNMTHKIHKLYFGKEHHLQTIKSKHPEAMLHLLEDKIGVHPSGGSSHYHIDIVPTWYHESAINNYYTYQYTYKYNHYVAQGQPQVLHFNYAIGGLIVQILPKNEDLFNFLTRLCAIVGGTYAIASAFHNLLSKFGSDKFQYQLIK